MDQFADLRKMYDVLSTHLKNHKGTDYVIPPSYLSLIPAIGKVKACIFIDDETGLRVKAKAGLVEVDKGMPEDSIIKWYEELIETGLIPKNSCYELNYIEGERFIEVVIFIDLID